MKALTAAAIYALALKAGFTPAQAVIATAIALAESGGRPDAIGDINNPVKGAKSVGLFQINWTPQMDKVSWRDPVANLDPLYNTQSAYTISNHGANFGPWTTYTKGIYKRFLATVEAAIAGPIVKPLPKPLPIPSAPPVAPVVAPVVAPTPLTPEEEIVVLRLALKVLFKLATQ